MPLSSSSSLSASSLSRFGGGNRATSTSTSSSSSSFNSCIPASIMLTSRHLLFPCALVLLLMTLSSSNSNGNTVHALPQFSSQLRRYAQAPIQSFLDSGIVDGGPVNINDPFYRAARENGVKWMRFGKRAPSHGKWMRFGKRAPSMGKWMRFGKRADGSGLDDYYYNMAEE